MDDLTKDLICIDPDAIEPWELEAYLDGARSPHVVEHLEHCESCRRWIETARVLDTLVNPMLQRISCPAPSELRDYLHGYVSNREHDALAEHISRCPFCQEELQMLVGSISSGESFDLEADWRRAKEAAARTGLVVPHWVQPNSAASTPVLRGETQEVLLFESAELAVTVSIEEEESGALGLVGQILSEDISSTPSGVVTLTSTADESGRRRSKQAPIDAAGGFVVSMLEEGIYQLVVELDECRVVIPGLRLG